MELSRPLVLCSKNIWVVQKHEVTSVTSFQTVGWAPVRAADTGEHRGRFLGLLGGGQVLFGQGLSAPRSVERGQIYGHRSGITEPGGIEGERLGVLGTTACEMGKFDYRP